MRNATLDALLEAAHSPDIEQRATAIWALRHHADNATERLLDALQDSEPVVREAAAAALGASKNEAGLWRLLETLGDRHYAVAAMAAKSLGAIAQQAAVPGLIQALRSASPEVRQAAARALSLIGDQAAVPYIQKLARTDIDAVRNVAREALLRLQYGKDGPVFEPEVIDFKIIARREKRQHLWARYAVAALLLIAFIPTGYALLTVVEQSDIVLSGFAGALPPEFTPQPSISALAEYNIDTRLYQPSASSAYFFMALSPDGEQLAAGTSSIDIWDTRSGELLYTIPRITNSAVYSLAFSPDGSLLATGSDDIVYLYDAKTGDLLSTLIGLDGAIHGLTFDLAGRNLFGVSTHVVMWNIETGSVLRNIPTADYDGSMISFAYDEQSRRFATGMRLPKEHNAWLWDIDTNTILFKFDVVGPTAPLGSANPVEALAYSPDGRYLATAPGYAQTPSDSRARPITIWDVNQGVAALKLEGHTNGVTALTYLREGRILVSTSYDETIKFWDTQTGQLLETLSPGGRIYDVAVSQNNNVLVTLTDDSIAVWQSVILE